MTDSMALAYLGDAVYEVFVRKRVMELNPGCHVDKLHQEAVKYVRAQAQADVLKILMNGTLTDEEITVVKRARNHKQISSKRIKSSKKGSDPVMEKLATAFEALIGYLHEEGREERLGEIVEAAFAIIEGAEQI
ncbi:MAG: ribonuclease III [Firmicutes bacterium]|nr:ribonuclease III [Bacillota bacterium]